MILGIVAGSIAFLVIVGIIIGLLTNNHASATPSAPITPDTGTPTAQAPAPPPSQPSDEPSQSRPTAGTGGGSSKGGTPGKIDFGTCSLTPSSGWKKKAVKPSEGIASVTDSSGDLFQAQCVQLGAGTDPEDVLSSWFDQLAKNCTDSKKQPADKIETGSPSLTAAQAQMTCAISDSQGSMNEGIASAAAVRKDGMTAVTTVFYSESSDTDQIGKDYSAMTVSVWSSLA